MSGLLALLPFLCLAPQDAPIPQKEFAARRARLMKHCSDGVVVLDSGRLLPGEAGVDANTRWYDFTYFTGVQPDDAILVLFPELNETVLFAEGDGLAKKTGLEHILDPAKFTRFLPEVLSTAERIYVKRGGRSAKLLRDAALSTRLGGITARMRTVKSEAELQCLRQAALATCAAHREAIKRARPGMNEGALQKIIEDTFRKEGGTGLAFPSIVGSGKNGTILHYMKNRDDMEDGSLVVLDIGASYAGYAADITRTIPVGGKFGGEHAKAYRCVLEAQKAAEKILRPGVTWRELHEAAKNVFEDRGMTKWSYSHAPRGSGVRHGLGHYVGLSVHDSGSYRSPLGAGMVVTIEPGYYDKDNGFGIRIEDTYIVTEDGYERISASAPREIAEIEERMRR